jgi:hypothetical protein
VLQEVEHMVSLWGRPWTRGELLARVGRLDQVAGVQLVEAGDGAERGVRLLRFTTGSGFGFDVLVDRGFDVGRAWLGGWPLAWWSPVGLHGRYTGLPARLAGYGTSWHGDECVLWAEGEVVQAAVFGEQLMLCRRIGPWPAPRLSAGVLTATPASAPAAPIPAPAHNPLHPVTS